MFEKTYKSMNSKIIADPKLIADTIDMMNGTNGLRKNHKAKARPIFRRPVAIAAAIVLCLTLATPVLAANVPAIYELMYLVSPTVAQYFIPVQKSYVDNGIAMEVVSTYIHNDTAQIYVTMQDLTGDRVDKTTDLFDSYSLHIPFDSNSHCEQVGFDETTRTATFLITISTMDGKDINIKSGKVTFSVREFLSHKTALEDVPVDVKLSNVQEATQTQSVYASGFSGKDTTSNMNASDKYTVLTPGSSLDSPIKGLDVTAIGYLDRMLHIQLATTGKLIFDPHGYFYLVDQDGNKVQSDYSVNFIEDADSDNRVDYQEFLFNIPQSEVETYSLYGSFYTSGLHTEGKWQVTFPLVTDESK